MEKVTITFSNSPEDDGTYRVRCLESGKEFSFDPSTEVIGLTKKEKLPIKICQSVHSNHCWPLFEGHQIEI